MKILYCIPSLSNSGGTERIVTEKINFLADLPNYFITIITTEGKNKIPFYELDTRVRIIELNLNFNEVFNEKLVKKIISTKIKLKEFASQLKTIIAENNIDICISTGGKELEFLSSLQVSCVKICEFHTSQQSRKLFLTSRKSGKFWEFVGDFRTKQLVRQTKKLDKLVVLTKTDEMIWKKTNSNISQIYNFSPLQQTVFSDLKSKKVIAVGRLVVEKGFDFLIDAWSLISKVNQEWKLEIYGKGLLEGDLLNQIKSNQLDDVINLMGHTKDVQTKIVASSIYALTSRYEGFPMVLLESLSCGVPIVSFDCETGPREIIENNDCGILVENRNVTEFADCLLEMMENTQMRIEKGKAAKEKSRQFSKEIIMKQWVMLFEDLYKRKK